MATAMSFSRSERILKEVVVAYRTALGRGFVALTLQTNLTTVHSDIDYSLFVRRLDAKTYARIAQINARLEKTYHITLDVFLYETDSFHTAINSWSAEIVRRNTVVQYGNNFWDCVSFTPSEIFSDARSYLKKNQEKFLRYIKNIGRQKKEWIIMWAIDHLFVAIKVYNSLFGFWSLGKERNLLELKRVHASLARRVRIMYQLYRNETVKDPIQYLAQCYALAERITVLGGKRTLSQCIRAYKKELAAG
jgi:hypothetical protein